MRDWIYAANLDIYIVVDIEGNRVKKIDMTRSRPSSPPNGTPFARALDNYVRTGREDFKGFVPDLDETTPFGRKVMSLLMEVPAGTTITYGELAAKAGSPGAARAVGNVMARNHVPLLVPCHRVVATAGLGGFAGGLDMKRKLLKLEGVSGPL